MNAPTGAGGYSILSMSSSHTLMEPLAAARCMPQSMAMKPSLGQLGNWAFADDADDTRYMRALARATAASGGGNDRWIWRRPWVQRAEVWANLTLWAALTQDDAVAAAAAWTNLVARGLHQTEYNYHEGDHTRSTCSGGLFIAFTAFTQHPPPPVGAAPA